MDRPPRVAIFASVSSPQQATVDKDSLPSQARDGAAWAAAIGGDVVATFRVPGHSRQYIFYTDAEADIPAYRQLRLACENRDFDVLWCRARNRLGRTDALISQVEAIVANAGAEVYSALMPHAVGQSNQASAIYIAAVERAAAEVENIDRVRMHAMGMKARVRRGLPACHWSYGYEPIRDDRGRTIGGQFTPEIAAVELMTTMYLRGESYDAIADALNASAWKPASARRWTYATVRNMLLGDFYAGYVTYGDARNPEPSDKFPALWNPDTHQAIIQERDRRQAGGRPPSSALSGILVCARCGWSMIAHTHHGILHYRCSKHNSKRRHGPCHCNWTPASRIFRILETFLLELASPAAIADELRRAVPDHSALETDIEQTRAHIVDLKAKRLRLAHAFRDGNMTADIYRIADDELLEELERAGRRQTELQTKLAAIPSLEERRAALERLIREPGWIERGPIKQVRAILQQSGLKIRIEAGQVTDILITL